MLVVANRIRVAAGWEAEFERRFRERESSLQSVPGFLTNEVLRPLKGDCYVVLTHWRDRAAFEGWKESEAFRHAHAERPPAAMFDGPSVLEIHEVILREEAAQAGER